MLPGSLQKIRESASTLGAPSPPQETTMAHPQYIREGGNGKPLHVSDAGFLAPRLSLALLKGEVNRYDLLKTPLQKAVDQGRKKITLREEFDKDLADLLQHVQDRLTIGVTEAWFSDQGYGLTADRERIEEHFKTLSPPDGPDEQVEFVRTNILPLFDFAEFFNTPEEIWARAFSEMTVFSMYANPGLLHYWKEDPAPLYAKFPSVYPIGIACQHLSTYCILSRGFKPSDVGSGCACGAGTIKLPCFDHAKSALSPPLAPGKDRQETAPSFADTSQLAAKGAGPGSIVAFNPGGPATESQDMGPYTHIGSILRRSGDKIQFIDTGVLVGSEDKSDNSKTQKVAGGEGGTTDHGFLVGVIPAAKHCVAVGVLNTPGDLVAAAEVTRKARPLGFARLAIVDISDKSRPEVRFVSQVYHMKYPVSHFIWSLRGLPIEGLRVIWMLYSPQGADFTEELILNSSNTPRAIYDAANKSWDAKRKVGEAQDKALRPVAEAAGKVFVPWAAKHPFGLYLANVVRGEPTGSAAICRRKSDKRDGYVEDFDAPKSDSLPSKPAVDMGQGLQLDLDGMPSLGAWSQGPRTLDLQFIRKPGSSGTTNGGAACGSFMAS